jgi:hypothetical protein
VRCTTAALHACEEVVGIDFVSAQRIGCPVGDWLCLLDAIDTTDEEAAAFTGSLATGVIRDCF